MKRRNINFTESQDLFFEHLTQESDLPLAEHVRRAMDNYINEMKQKNINVSSSTSSRKESEA